MHKMLVATLLSATLLAGTADAAQQTPAPPSAPQGRPTPPDPLLLADANKDGVVTRDEVTARLSAAFARVDADGDGKISPAEREAVREVLGGPGGPGMDGPPPPPRGPEGRPGMRGRMAERMAARMDKDGDGMVSLDEQKARALARFDRVDTNKDGKIDATERKAMHDRMLAMRDRRGPRGPGGPGGPGGHMPPPPPPPADASDS